MARLRTMLLLVLMLLFALPASLPSQGCPEYWEGACKAEDPIWWYSEDCWDWDQICYATDCSKYTLLGMFCDKNGWLSQGCAYNWELGNWCPCNHWYQCLFEPE